MLPLSESLIHMLTQAPSRSMWRPIWRSTNLHRSNSLWDPPWSATSSCASWSHTLQVDDISRYKSLPDTYIKAQSSEEKAHCPAARINWAIRRTLVRRVTRATIVSALSLVGTAQEPQENHVPAQEIGNQKHQLTSQLFKAGQTKGYTGWGKDPGAQ